MVAGSEIADMVNAFRMDESEDNVKKHNEDTASFEKHFRKDVAALCNIIR